jgi:hypothetical protein
MSLLPEQVPAHVLLDVDGGEWSLRVLVVSSKPTHHREVDLAVRIDGPFTWHYPETIFREMLDWWIEALEAELERCRDPRWRPEIAPDPAGEGEAAYSGSVAWNDSGRGIDMSFRHFRRNDDIGGIVWLTLDDAAASGAVVHLPAPVDSWTSWLGEQLDRAQTVLDAHWPQAGTPRSDWPKRCSACADISR